jgi:hypothetical protein
VVSERVRGQLRAGLSAGPVQSGGLVSAEPGARAGRAAVADSRARPRPAPFRLSPDLGAAAPRGLADQSQARAPALSPRRAPGAHARPPTQAHGTAPRAGAGARRSRRALEQGLRARCAGGRPPVSGPDGGGSVESPESLTGGRLEHVRRDRRCGVGSRARRVDGSALDHR